MLDEVSESVRVGETRPVVDEERAAMAAIVAEVASAEQVAPATDVAADEDTDGEGAAPEPWEAGAGGPGPDEPANDVVPSAEGPIIVESASRARLREEAEAAEMSGPR